MWVRWILRHSLRSQSLPRPSVGICRRRRFRAGFVGGPEVLARGCPSRPPEVGPNLLIIRTLLNRPFRDTMFGVSKGDCCLSAAALLFSWASCVSATAQRARLTNVR